MSLIHDIIKIKYSQLGYLPNYPYHLISDREMFDAFINLTEEPTTDDKFFNDWYPNPFIEDNVDLSTTDIEMTGTVAYNKLVDYIVSSILGYLDDIANGIPSKLPDWIYSYMLGEVVYKNSDYMDIEDVLTLLDCNNLDNDFTVQACVACYKKSSDYISTLSAGSRPASMFAEPHVIKQLRLEA